MQMTLGVAVDISKSPDEVCPWGCGKKPHDDYKSKKQSENTKIESKPDQLGCSDVPGGGEGKWTTAKHHLIPAKQCFAKVRRLARMAMSVGYDINDKKNGIGLPTIKNPYTYEGKTKNYGKFTKNEKKEIAFDVMDKTNMQWHVGHHRYKMGKYEECGPDDEPSLDQGVIDHQTYDMEVIDRLIKEMCQWDEAKICEEKDEDLSEEAKECMNRISKEIEDKLKAFQYGNSKPYFVSELARIWKPKHNRE